MSDSLQSRFPFTLVAMCIKLLSRVPGENLHDIYMNLTDDQLECIRQMVPCHQQGQSGCCCTWYLETAGRERLKSS